MLPIIGELINAGKDVLRRILPREKMSEEEIQEAERAFEETIKEREDQFNSFVLKHTGEAKDMPRFIQIIRGLVRPIITLSAVFGFFWFSWWLFNNITTITSEQQLGIIREIQVTLKSMLVIVLVFWFGDKVLVRTGAMDVLKNLIDKKKGKDA